MLGTEPEGRRRHTSGAGMCAAYGNAFTSRRRGQTGVGGSFLVRTESAVVAEGGVPAGFRLFDNRKRGNQKSPHAQEDARQARSCRRKTGGLSSAALGRRAERGAAGGGRRRGRWVCTPRPSLRQRLSAPSGLMGRCEGRVWPQLGRLKCVCGRDGPAGAGKGQSHHVT